jgi:micrococcal nuclease
MDIQRIKQSKMKYSNANTPNSSKKLLKIAKFVDGDGIILEEILSKKQFEVRFLGIDAPELNYCDKIKKDEKELQIPAALLIKLGYLSLQFLMNNVSLNETCELIQEQHNLVDKYGRSLGYLVLSDGRTVNELMIKEGFAKPYNEVFCKMLPLYQEWNLEAKNSCKGLYKLVNKF